MELAAPVTGQTGYSASVQSDPKLGSLVAERRTLSALSEAERAAWIQMARTGLHLASPYFSLAYHDAVSRVRRDVEVAVIRRGANVIGFWPYQRGPVNYARPVGGPLSDHHGLIADDPDSIDLAEVMKQVGIGAFDYFGAPAAQAEFRRHGVVHDGSWVADLSEGFAAFSKRQKKFGGNTFRNIAASIRKLTEDGGKLTFRFDDRRPEAFDALMRWKSAQYIASGHFDVFSVDWTRNLLTRLQAEDGGDARGLLSSLELDGELVAVHFGLLGERAFHYWFPAYDPALAKRGPGNALLMHVLETLCERGVTEVHLGPGNFRYKAALGSWQIPLAVGVRTTPSATGVIRQWAGAIEDAGERLPVRALGTLPGRVFRRIDRSAGFRG